MKTILATQSVGSCRVVSLYPMRSVQAEKPGNGSLTLESLVVYCCPELSFKEHFVTAGIKPSPQSEVQLGVVESELNVSLSLSISVS